MQRPNDVRGHECGHSSRVGLPRTARWSLGLCAVAMTSLTLDVAGRHVWALADGPPDGVLVLLLQASRIRRTRGGT